MDLLDLVASAELLGMVFCGAVTQEAIVSRESSKAVSENLFSIVHLFNAHMPDMA